MYYSYFGLNEAPFSIAPNPDYLLMTERHQEALAHLYHGIESDAGFVLLTGEIGTGKTTVCRRFLNSLPDKTQLAFVLNPCLDDIELLQAICRELKIDFSSDDSLRALSDNIYQCLLESHKKGINTVLLIDEAQQMNQKTLELVRLLTNLETDTQKLLKIILVGQPELNELLNKPELLQLSQRITARYHIKPLSVNELNHYVDHRLKMAGYKQEQVLFSSSRIKQLFALSQGIPRVVNVICDRALLGVYSSGEQLVNKKILNKAFQEVSGNYLQKSSTDKKLYGVILLFALSLFAYSLFYYYSNIQVTERKTEPVVQETPAIEEPVITKSQLMEDKPLVVLDEEIENQAEERLQASSIFEYGFRSENKAISILFENLLPNQKGVNSCDDIGKIDWRCDTASVLSWTGFKEINRPGVIHLVREEESAYIVVVALDNSQATILYQQPITEEATKKNVSLAELDQYWSGDFVYLWQAPAGFERFIYKDSSEDQIYWLADLFAQLDEQGELLAEANYNSRLKKRIEIFQQQHSLKEDGKAGTQTLLKLNEAVGVAMTLGLELSGSKN